CGGKNLAVGQRVAVALIGARVRWHGEGELVEIQETEIRGVKSKGMICSQEELGFDTLAKAGEIWDLTNITSAKPGTGLSEALELDDDIFDIEITTNRPDGMSIVGLAREASACGLGTFLYKPAVMAEHGAISNIEFSVSVKESGLCPRYSAVALDNVSVGPSPWWMQKALILAGIRPINNITDITNYVLLELGAPMHAFDYDKLEGNKIIVRKAKKSEKIMALDAKEYELSDEMLVIADAKKPVAIAGVMGGEQTGISESTTRIVFECASFDSVSVRKTSRALNLRSDSQQLFEKGLSTEAIEPAMARAVELAVQIAGGQIASGFFDERTLEYNHKQFTLVPEKVRALSGIEMDETEMVRILSRLGFVCEKENDSAYKVIVPWWRDHDIEDDVDLTEEISRVYGYGNIAPEIPANIVPNASTDPFFVHEKRIKRAMREFGFTEMYSYSFVSKKQLETSGIDPQSAVALANPLSDEFAYMRPSLVPSALFAIDENRGRFPSAKLFELSFVYEKRKNDLPKESPRLLISAYSQDANQSVRDVKGAVVALMRELGAGCVFEQTKNKHKQILRSGKDAIGEFWADGDIIIAEIDLQKLAPYITYAKQFLPIPEFPPVKRDISFSVDAQAPYDEIESVVLNASELLTRVELFDIFQGKRLDFGKKNLALHLTFEDKSRTLTAEEADAEMKNISESLQSSFSAIIR
ncbi:TPA: phenylalanine--tRNA ligase subunit beta, partial [Candidatus Uhrbacteria bacterium]|nr:phenylalanine--tRNA ligase subunit beta [Candidatus Uhrbacteria bacterium]